jgi:hypothetical protein
MLYFPQLMTGTAAQLPCAKRVLQRTVTNVQLDGGMVKVFDPGAYEVQWDMQLSGLTSEEWSAIEGLFRTVEGRLGTFCFLDPFGNLLRWSEDLSAGAWNKGPAIQASGGSADPFGTSRASVVSNTGTAEQDVSQTVAVPGWFQYCFSLYARSDAPGTIKLFASPGADPATRVVKIGPQWRRFELSTAPGAQTEAVTFGVTIEPGTAVTLFGLQAEAQPGASGYRATSTHCGVFSNASFLDDELPMTSNAPGEFSSRIRIRAVS